MVTSLTSGLEQHAQTSRAVGGGSGMKRGAAPRVARADVGYLLTGQKILQQFSIVPERRLEGGESDSEIDVN